MTDNHLTERCHYWYHSNSDYQARTILSLVSQQHRLLGQNNLIFGITAISISGQNNFIIGITATSTTLPERCHRWHHSNIGQVIRTLQSLASQQPEQRYHNNIDRLIRAMSSLHHSNIDHLTRTISSSASKNHPPSKRNVFIIGFTTTSTI